MSGVPRGRKGPYMASSSVARLKVTASGDARGPQSHRGTSISSRPTSLLRNVAIRLKFRLRRADINDQRRRPSRHIAQHRAVTEFLSHYRLGVRVVRRSTGASRHQERRRCSRRRNSRNTCTCQPGRLQSGDAKDEALDTSHSVMLSDTDGRMLTIGSNPR
jgi:hypothetical protein